MECSAASLAITFNLLRNDKLFPNRNVITTACGIRIFNPYFPPPIKPESIAATSSHNNNDDDDDDDVVVVEEVLCSVMGSSRCHRQIDVYLFTYRYDTHLSGVVSHLRRSGLRSPLTQMIVS